MQQEDCSEERCSGKRCCEGRQDEVGAVERGEAGRSGGNSKLQVQLQMHVRGRVQQMRECDIGTLRTQFVQGWWSRVRAPALWRGLRQQMTPAQRHFGNRTPVQTR